MRIIQSKKSTKKNLIKIIDDQIQSLEELESEFKEMLTSPTKVIQSAPKIVKKIQKAIVLSKQEKTDISRLEEEFEKVQKGIKPTPVKKTFSYSGSIRLYGLRNLDTVYYNHKDMETDTLGYVYVNVVVCDYERKIDSFKEFHNNVFYVLVP